MYLYQTTIYRDTSNVYGIDKTQNDLDKANFEANYKASTYLISELQLSETTLLVVKTYTQFKTLIVSPILWTDVKRTEDVEHYDIYLMSENPL